MTECGPLIAYANSSENRMASCGRIVDRVEARIDSPEPTTKPGILYVKGENVILGPSGQNIYPEEIEDKLNNLPYISESLIIDSGEGRLIALIYPDIESITSQGLSAQAVNDIMTDNIKTLNTDLPAYSQVQRFKLLDEEFEKTPKRSIKRYLYQQK